MSNWMYQILITVPISTPKQPIGIELITPPSIGLELIEDCSKIVTKIEILSVIWFLD